MKPIFYMLDGKKVIATEDMSKWGEQFKSENFREHRRVNVTEIDGLRISTVFLGTDHQFGLSGPPRLFETMVFGLPDDEEIKERYCTWEEAAAGHKKICEQMRRKKGPRK